MLNTEAASEMISSEMLPDKNTVKNTRQNSKEIHAKLLQLIENPDPNGLIKIDLAEFPLNQDLINIILELIQTHPRLASFQSTSINITLPPISYEDTESSNYKLVHEFISRLPRGNYCLASKFSDIPDSDSALLHSNIKAFIQLVATNLNIRYAFIDRSLYPLSYERVRDIVMLIKTYKHFLEVDGGCTLKNEPPIEMAKFVKEASESEKQDLLRSSILIESISSGLTAVTGRLLNSVEPELAASQIKEFKATAIPKGVWKIEHLLQYNGLKLPPGALLSFKRESLIEKLQSKTPGFSYEFDITLLDEETTSLILKEHRKFSEMISENGRLILDCRLINETTLDKIIEHMHAIPRFTSFWSVWFRFTDNSIHFPMILKFLSRLKKIDLHNLDFSECELNKVPVKELMDFFTSIVTRLDFITSINLTRNQIYSLGIDNIIKLLDILTQNKIKTIMLSSNELWKLPITDLEKILAHCNTKTDVRVDLISTTEKVVATDWDEETRLRFAKFQIQGYSKSSSFASGGDCTIISVPLPQKDSFKLMYDWLLADYHEDGAFSVKAMPSFIKQFNFDEKERYELAELIHSRTGYFGHIKDFKLEPQVRLRYFIEDLEKDHEHFLRYICQYDLMTGDFGAKTLFTAWQSAAQIVESYTPFEAEDAYEILCKEVLPGLREACKKLLPGENFHELLLKRIADFSVNVSDDDSYAIQKLSNMLGWFTWFIAVITTLKFDITLSAYSRAFKEILDFAEPGLRYKLGRSLLNVLQNPKARQYYEELTNLKNLSSLSHKSKIKTTSILLPSIYLTEMLVKEDKEQDELLKASNKLLQSIPSYFDQGHYLKPLVSTAGILATSSEVTAQKKIALLTQILAGSSEKQKLIEMLSKAIKPGLSLEMLKESIHNILNEKEFKDIQEVFKQKIEKLGLFNAGKLSAHKKRPEKNIVQKEEPEKVVVPSEAAEKPLESRAIQALKRRLLLEIIPSLFEQEERRNRSTFLIMLQGFAALNELHTLAELPLSKFKEAIPTVYQKIFGLTETAFSFYPQNIAGQRNEAAPLTLLGRYRTHDKEASKLTQKLSDYIAAVLSKDSMNFYDMRYDTKTLEHLKTIFELYPELQKAWRINVELDFDEFIRKNKIAAKPFDPNFKELIHSVLFQHQHLPDSHDLGRLKQYMETEDASQKELLKLALKPSPQVQGQPKQVKIYAELLKNFQFNIITLLETDKQDRTTQIKVLRKIASDLKQLISYSVEFTNDLTGWIKALELSTQKKTMRDTSKWKFIFTDHYWHLLLCGTDVANSCQRVDGDPDLNQCLLAYLLDGKNKMLGIVDETNTLRARAFLRLLWDPVAKKPVLFLEQIYPAFLSSDESQGIIQFAKTIAERLQLMLLCAKKMEDSSPYPNAVVSLHGIGPEYVDALHDVEEEGSFEIKNAELIYTPSMELKPKPLLPLWDKTLSAPLALTGTDSATTSHVVLAEEETGVPKDEREGITSQPEEDSKVLRRVFE